MNSKTYFIPAILVSGVLCLVSQAAPPAAKKAATPAAPAQKAFDTPELAAAGLVQAAAAFEVPALKEILGPDSDDII